jgi:hypothetical protein
MIFSTMITSIMCIAFTTEHHPVIGSEIDCGVRALYSLFQLEQHPISLERLLASLPKRDPKGYSISELSKCANSNGMNVKAIQLDKNHSRLNRPIIVLYLIRDQGHYLLINPIGISGKLVQTIEYPYPPKIISYQNLFNNLAFTGRAIVPVYWYETKLFVTLARISSFIFLLSGIYIIFKKLTYDPRACNPKSSIK